MIKTASDADRLYAFIKDTSLDPGTLFTKSDLADAIGKSNDGHRSAIYRVIRRLERNDQRTLICEHGVGYRVAHPNETTHIVARRRKRARRQIALGLHTGRNADRGMLNQSERQELDRLNAAQIALQREMRQVEKRLSIGEARIDALEQQPRLSANEVRLVRDLLRSQEK